MPSSRLIVFICTTLGGGVSGGGVNGVDRPRGGKIDDEDVDNDVVIGARMEGPEVKAEIGAEITIGLGEGVREEGNELAGLGSVTGSDDFVSR